ncbi:MAG: CCA tRNA nucleotidyltransferase [Candidatus Roizmanbacteria bacterium]|nr:MAG: CCA tRNA nucleotidyltransferase [Candidatus Roizmanbacteria bacterium]
MFTLPEEVKDFMDNLNKKGYQIYVVGGAVRDLLLKNETSNWDFTTNATPDEVLKLYPNGFYNNQFGTVGIEIEINGNKNIFEVTTYRKEENYTNLRHPSKIEWAKTLEEDLARRDFTINAIAYDGEKITDPYSGQKHLKDKLITAVGDPDKRFNEDALRLIRAIRLASQLGFQIEEKTREAIKKDAHLIKHISGERIRDELFKILRSDNAAEGILFLKNTGLLKYILPELDEAFLVGQKSPKRHHIYDVGTHSIMSLKNSPSKDAITRLAILLHDIGKVKAYRKDQTGLITFYNHEVIGAKQVEQIADRLRLSNKQKEKLVTLIRHHQFSVTEMQTDKAVRRFIRDVGKENVQDMLDLRVADRSGSGATPTSWRLELFKKRIEEVQKEPFKVTDLKINGNDVMKILNLKPGPKIGETLNQIFNEVIEGKLKNEREELLKKILDLRF